MSYSGYGSYSSYSSYSSSSSSYRSGRTSLSSYTPSSYEPYSWRKTSAYTPRTYDFGAPSYLSGSSGDTHYSSKYNEYSWKAKDLLTDNLENKEVDVQLKDSIKDNTDVSTEKVEKIEEKDGGLARDNSIDEVDTKKEEKRDYSSYLKESNIKDFSKDIGTKEDNSRDTSSTDILKSYYSMDYSRDKDNSTRKDSSEMFKGLYNKDYYSKYYGTKPTRDDDDTKKRLLSDKINEKDDKKSKTDVNQNYSRDKRDVPAEKKVYNFEEDDDVFVKPKEEKTVNTGINDLFNAIDGKPTDKKAASRPDSYITTKQRPVESPKKVEKQEKLKNVANTGPLRMHRQGVTKFISAIPDQRRYVSSVNFLPDKIELRFVGVPHQNKMKRCRSITDLYEITVEPEQDKKENGKIHPWEETVRCRKQDTSYSYDSENEILYYTKTRHEHTKEMYISQYTHHFDQEEPRTHIAGWKCDVEPNGIPHQKSRMCVVRSPVVSESRKRAPRPKSAPPQLVASLPEPAEEPIRSVKVDVVERGYYTIPRKHGRQEDNDSATEDVSSVGYAPSDDTSDSSAFYFNDPRFQSPKPKDPDFGYNKPRLIRLSAEFPGIRNLEKMRRKRQSMGSYSSAGSLSSAGQTPSPRKGDYGFFVALTSDPRKEQQQQKQPKRQHRHSHWQ